MATENKWAEKWRAECERLALNLCLLIRIGDMKPSGAAVLELLRSLPESASETMEETSFFARCAKAAMRNVTSWDEKQLQSVTDYLVQYAAMSPARRKMLEATLTGVLVGFGLGG